MCLAICKPQGITIPKDHLESGYLANYSDHCGCGFAYNVDGKLVVEKGIMPFDEFYQKYQEVEKHPMLIHFRLATHKPINTENCHPFTMCDGNFAFIHNGVFRIAIKNLNLSDTGNFCEQVMEPMIKNGRYKNKKHMENLIGWNLCCLMSNTGEVIIYNSESGHWLNGVWYSNHGFMYKNYCSEDY